MSDTLLERLRSEEATASLARLVVSDLLSRPPAEVIDARFTAELVQRSLHGWLQSDAAETRTLEAVARLRSRLAEEDRQLGDVVSEDLVAAARRLAARPYQPAQKTLLAILDRGPVRRLVREILRETLIEFAKRVRAPVAENRVAKSLGGLGRFAKSAARARTGSIGALAGGLMGAVSDEVERQMERRAAEFADGAISGVLQRFTDELCDPRRAEDQAALRGAFLDGILALRGSDAAEELDRIDPEELVSWLRSGLSDWTERDDFAETIEGIVARALAEVDAPTLGDLLDQNELREAIVGPAIELVRRRLQPVLGSDAFADWFLALADT
jgi:hypothetical protein